LNERNNIIEPPSAGSRRLALVVGPGYLLLLASALGGATRTSLAVVLPVTLLAALAIMAVLAFLGAKAYEYRHSAVRFTLSTAFLISLPLCIYLAALRWVLQSVPRSELELDWASGIALGVFALLSMFITTVVLLWLAEALVWLAVGLRRCFRGR
jgi:hypothetical protein